MTTDLWLLKLNDIQKVNISVCVCVCVWPVSAKSFSLYSTLFKGLGFEFSLRKERVEKQKVGTNAARSREWEDKQVLIMTLSIWVSYHLASSMFSFLHQLCYLLRMTWREKSVNPPVQGQWEIINYSRGTKRNIGIQKKDFNDAQFLKENSDNNNMVGNLSLPLLHCSYLFQLKNTQ